MDHGRFRNLHMCHECIWFDQCAEYEICEDFSPAEYQIEIAYYEKDLDMRAAVYLEMIDECGDGNVTHDGF